MTNTKLSVNINKIATLRNARGGNVPDIVKVAIDTQKFGGQGITIHPRPDERHITRKDVYDLKKVVTTEYNIEGNPTEDFIKLVLDVMPEQVTLVPDAPDAITSNAGWDTIANKGFLTEVISEFKNAGIRTSIFIDTEDAKLIEGAKICGADRVELYTEEFATQYDLGNKKAIIPYIDSAKLAVELGMGLNAGHDLSLDNIEFFAKEIPGLQEVSIGHALISEALYIGLEKTIKMYLQRLA
ncbi:MAG: pyridoxine 5'-phosphate synthase [Ichthyobacteriaceae bacterium]|nr:pyridoxine 5'-phosphate synthase [Ichthyobacteriaceae bacterium]